MINSISIILPIFNEERRIKENLIKIKKFNLAKFIKIKEFILWFKSSAVILPLSLNILISFPPFEKNSGAPPSSLFICDSLWHKTLP